MKYFPIVVVLFSAVFGFALDARAGEPRNSLIVEITSRDDFETLIADAWKLYQERKYDEAIKLCEKAIQLRPSDNRGYAIAGVASMGQQKMQQASNFLALAIKFSPRNAVLHYNKARADRYRNAKEEGLVSIRTAIQLKPDYAEAYHLMGDLLGIGGKNYQEQIAAFRKAIELKPDLLAAYPDLGRTLAVSGDNKAAEEVYRRGMEIDPKKRITFFDLGRLLVKQERLVEARELWEKRPEGEDRTFPNFLTVLERAEKQAAAKKAFELKPNDPEVLVRYGLVVMDGESWVVDDRWDRAIVHFRKALQIEPNYLPAQHALCKAYVELASIEKDKNAILDVELIKLRKLDPKLADEIAEYRKTYFHGLRGFGDPKRD